MASFFASFHYFR